MKNKLEQLLNSLIEKGWKPFGYNDFTKATVEENENVPGKKVIHLWTDLGIDTESLIRIICIKESGLWQFVCDREYRFIDKKNYEGVRSDKRLKNPYVDYDGVNTEYEWITSLDYQFRLIESALKDESELEDFLIGNIKTEGIS